MGFAVIKVVSQQTVSLLLHVLRAQWGCHTFRVWWMFEHFHFVPRVFLLGVLCSLTHSHNSKYNCPLNVWSFLTSVLL